MLGDIIPNTVLSRVFLIFYVLFGIPIFGFAMAILGEQCALFVISLHKMEVHVMKWIRTKCTCRRKKQKTVHVMKSEASTESSSSKGTVEDDPDDFPLLMSTLICIAWIVGVTVFYALIEDWPFFDSFYFLFQSFLTIGFGGIFVILCKHFQATSLRRRRWRDWPVCP